MKKKAEKFFNEKATRWVIEVAGPMMNTADQLLVAVAMAPHASIERWDNIFVSVERLAELTHLERKRILRARAQLADPKGLHLIADTGKRIGKTGKIIVWKLCPEQSDRRTIAPEQTVPSADHSMVPKLVPNSPETGGAIVPHRDLEVIQEVVHEQPPREPAHPREPPALPQTTPEPRTPAVEEDPRPIPTPTPDELVGTFTEALVAAAFELVENDPRPAKWLLDLTKLGYPFARIINEVNTADFTQARHSKIAYLKHQLGRGSPAAAAGGREAAQKSVDSTLARVEEQMGWPATPMPEHVRNLTKPTRETP